jgi:DNA-binding MarR family transcriptional regulator
MSEPATSVSAVDPRDVPESDRRNPEADDVLPLLLYQVKRLQLVIQALMDNELRRYEVTPLQWTILSLLVSPGSHTAASMARSLFLQPQTMHEIVTVLEQRGLVHRHRDPNDGRSLLMELTDQGKDLLGGSTRDVAELEAALTSALTPGQALSFRESLHACIAAMATEAETRHVKADGSR